MKTARILVLMVALFAFAGTSHAWFLDFEWGLGQDYEPIHVPGLDFAYANYIDATTGHYSVSSDNGGEWNNGDFWLGGNVALNAPLNGFLRIDFANTDGSWFTTGYCIG